MDILMMPQPTLLHIFSRANGRLGLQSLACSTGPGIRCAQCHKITTQLGYRFLVWA